MFAAPGVTVESSGLVQADLLDVRTGTILFSVVEPMAVHGKEWMIGAGRSHRELQGEAASAAAKKLARRVAEQTNALVAYAERMGDARRGAGQGADHPRAGPRQRAGGSLACRDCVAVASARVRSAHGEREPVIELRLDGQSAGRGHHAQVVHAGGRSWALG